MSRDRSWMYRRFLDERNMNPEFLRGVDRFVEEAFKHPPPIVESIDNLYMIRCPCRVCDNTEWLVGDEVRRHLNLRGFTLYYDRWLYHGEGDTYDDSDREVVNEGVEEVDRMNEMVLDAAGPDFNWDTTEEVPNSTAKEFYEMLEAAEKPLWELEANVKNLKCRESLLSIVSQLLNLKSDYNLPRECFNRMTSIIKSVLPEKDTLPPNLYEAKKLLRGLGLKYIKIDVCPNDCMLYYNDRLGKEKCDICGEPRYKSDMRKKKGKPVARKVLRYLPITPRLQRLYMSSATAEHMRWHKSGVREKPGVMVHPADGEAWKCFDRVHTEFAREVRNVRLGFATDGFTPFSLSAVPYSCWPGFIVVYNLPPGVAMKSENIFLSLVIPGSRSPGRDIDVFLEPLLDELDKLWNEGVETFDCFRKQNFQMKAALLWTISDFPAYGMLSGWSTHGRLACPICMGSTNAFRLKKGNKACWFDHRAFLPISHRFRRDKKRFIKDKRVVGQPPERLSGEDIHEEVMELRRLRKKVGNKAHPEGSIVEAYMIEEISNFCSIYFSSAVRTRLNRNPRHDDERDHLIEDLSSIFAHPGRPIGKSTRRILDAKEIEAAQLYVLLNCPEVQEFIEEYDELVRRRRPGITDGVLNRLRDQQFVSWIRKKVSSDRTIDRTVRDIGLGPYDEVTCYGAYDVNGYRFHTEEYGIGKATTNSGVCIKGGWHDGTEHDYYGILEDIVELEYRGLANKVVLFKCKWFDVSRGVKVDKRHGLVEVNHTSKLSIYEPFVFAVDAIQVYYLRYPSTKKERKNWWVSIKTKSKILPSFGLNEEVENSASIDTEFFQEDGLGCPFTIGEGDDIPVTLNNGDDAVEPLSVADVEYLMQQMELAHHEDEMPEDEMPECEDESEYEREFDGMDYEEVVDRDDVTDSDSDPE